MIPSSKWPSYPVIYEINTWVWLAELRRKYGAAIELSSVPGVEWDGIASYGFDAIWFMGVWERSPAGTAIANQNQALLEEFRRALPDFRPEDNVGSPYCIRNYSVDQHLGGAEGLAVARGELARRGLKLILDFVPNHVAPDHPWVSSHPEYFIRGGKQDLQQDPNSYLEIGGQVLACGRDPYFPAWHDVLQVNAFDAGLRQAAIATLRDIATQCDGVRCDMAMLLLNDVFQRTWGERAGTRPQQDYWREVIPAIKQAAPNFLFMAEAYWELEWELQQQGFDFCYDKKLYDRLEHGDAESIRLHLCADRAYQDKLVRFIENHDEPRAASSFPDSKQRAAAVTIATLPGARLFHEGQVEGRKVKLPVFLGRRPEETVNLELHDFYSRLLAAIDSSVFRDGEWKLCDRSGWPDNNSYRNLVAWTWNNGGERYLIVVNLSDIASQARVHPGWTELAGSAWQLRDLLKNTTYPRDGTDIATNGLYVELDPWDYHFLQFSR